MPYKDLEVRKEYQKEYRKLHKKEKREYNYFYYSSRRKKYRKYTNNYRKKNRKKFLLQSLKDSKKYRKRYPLKIKAHKKANYFIKIPRGELCQLCDKKKAREKHHVDYDKPLIIVFLCFECHRKVHKKL